MPHQSPGSQFTFNQTFTSVWLRNYWWQHSNYLLSNIFTFTFFPQKQFREIRIPVNEDYFLYVATDFLSAQCFRTYKSSVWLGHLSENGFYWGETWNEIWVFVHSQIVTAKFWNSRRYNHVCTNICEKIELEIVASDRAKLLWQSVTLKPHIERRNVLCRFELYRLHCSQHIVVTVMTSAGSGILHFNTSFYVGQKCTITNHRRSRFLSILISTLISFEITARCLQTVFFCSTKSHDGWFDEKKFFYINCTMSFWRSFWLRFTESQLNRYTSSETSKPSHILDDNCHFLCHLFCNASLSTRKVITVPRVWETKSTKKIISSDFQQRAAHHGFILWDHFLRFYKITELVEIKIFLFL